MPKIIKENIKQNKSRIWGNFILSDNSKTEFEMRKNKDWFQWGNSTENLSLSVDRVIELCNKWKGNN